MKLLQPGKIGTMTLKNRVFMAPMGTTSEADGSFSDRCIRYLEERAIGGFAMIITGANQVTLDYEQKACNVIGSARSREQLNFLARRIHGQEAKLCVQLTIGLGRMQLPTAAAVAPLAASEVESFWFPGLMCKPLSIDQIHDLVEKMGASAAFAKEAGADCVEIHGYGGYLLDQFSSSLWNKRTDEYGGDLAGRMKISLEIIASMREAVGADFPIIYKFTPYHGVPGGRELDEGLEMARILESAGVDALHVDYGAYDAWYKAIPTVYQHAPTAAWLAAEVKNIAGVPVLATGKLNDPNTAESVLEKGQSDFIGLAHGALTEPHWVNKVRSGQAYDIVPCIGCNECLNSGFGHGAHYHCAVNPQCYAEDYFPVLPMPDRKRVLVLGGGPGGMEAAIIAAERGAEVELWEKSARLGGLLWAAGGPDFKVDVEDYAKYLVGKTFRSNVKVRTMKDASPEEIVAGRWDKVIMASGAHAAIPPIPGIESKNVVMANDVLTGVSQIGRRVVVIGAGLVGCETAAMCAERADQVTVIELLPEILSGVDHCLNNRQALDQLLEDSEIEFITGARVGKIEEERVSYSKDGRAFEIEADTVVVAAGYVSNNELYDQLAEKVDVSIIGDAAKPDSILTAVSQGFQLARSL
ncbi:NAD(P)/FAD-dependent oxidoreductase [Brooklawnia sp.]|uniref:NAD(P)/FAD-dependent oxidoreductase n=1 Tax=Brooklawnia sp. TaxID=2699740 RepID=UPI00311D9591